MSGDILDALRAEYNAEFKGWDFSYLLKAERMVESVLPWNYRQIIQEYYYEKDTLLDMGTGGGEFLITLENLPPNVYATEGYASNLDISRNRLRKIGAQVEFIKEDNIIPYPDRRFDVVINRHEEYKA